MNVLRSIFLTWLLFYSYVTCSPHFFFPLAFFQSTFPPYFISSPLPLLSLPDALLFPSFSLLFPSAVHPGCSPGCWGSRLIFHAGVQHTASSATGLPASLSSSRVMGWLGDGGPLVLSVTMETQLTSVLQWLLSWYTVICRLHGTLQLDAVEGVGWGRILLTLPGGVYFMMCFVNFKNK